jgi:hypothetical protein
MYLGPEKLVFVSKIATEHSNQPMKNKGEN